MNNPRQKARRCCCARLWFFLVLSMPPAGAQILPQRTGGDLQRAAQHIERGEYSKAIEILVPLERVNPRSFDVQHLLAIALDITGKPEDANLHFQKALAINPKSAGAHANLGTSFVRIGKTEAAVLEFRQALKIDPSNTTANFNLGTLFLQERKFKDALPLLQKAYSLQPAVYENGYHLALCYFLLGDHSSAQKALDALMPVPRERAEFYLVLALNQRASGKIEAAQQALREILPTLVAQPDAHEQITMLLFSQQMYREAIPVLEEAVRRFPTSHAAAANLALAEQRVGELPKAQEHAQRALELRETPEGHILLGDILEAARQPMAAIEHYQRAARLDPSERNLIALGYEFLSHWNWKEAQDVFALAVTRFSGSWRLLMGLGASCLGQEDFEKATQYILQAIELAPEEILGYQLLSQSFSDSTDSFEKAVARFRAFYRTHPKDAWAAYYSVLAAFRSAVRTDSVMNYEEVIGLLKSAIARKPVFPEAYFLLGEINYREKKWNEAVSAYESAVKFSPEHISAHYKLGLSLQRVGQAERAAFVLRLYEQLKERQNQAAGEWLARNSRFIVAPNK